MDINELLKYLNSQSNQPIGTSIGNEALHATVNTNPTLRGDVTAMQPTEMGLLSATIGKEINQPSFKDYALTRDDMRYGVINQKGDNIPYAEYMNPNVMARIMGGKSPAVMADMTGELLGGKASIGGQFDASGLEAKAAYEKKLKDWVLQMSGSISPEQKMLNFGIGRSF
jgi:hypothetical protein